jgi:hypothetical protein
MKIIAAAWERRNLGLDVTEVTVEQRDLEDEQETLEVLKKYMLPRHYLLVKTPIGAIAFLAKLQALGFIFLECQYTLSVKLGNYVLPSRFASLAEDVSLEALSRDKTEWLDLLRLIGDDLFTTDRVALDPMFGVHTANKRYKNWIMDMWENRSASAYKVLHKGENLGFNIMSFNTQTQAAHSVLTGILNRYHGSGLGGTMILAPIIFNIEKGMKLYTTAISSNNQPVFRLYIHLGFNIKTSSYVLRYCPEEVV